MLLSRVVVVFGVSALSLLAATGKPGKPVVKPSAEKAAEKAIVQRWLKGMTLHDEVAQLIIMPCYGESINTRSRVFRQYQHLVRDVHVGGLIVLGHSFHGSIHNAEPYAMAALFNRMQNLSPVPLLIAADFERGASMRVNSTTPWPFKRGEWRAKG